MSCKSVIFVLPHWCKKKKNHNQNHIPSNTKKLKYIQDQANKQTNKQKPVANKEDQVAGRSGHPLLGRKGRGRSHKGCSAMSATVSCSSK